MSGDIDSAYSHDAYEEGYPQGIEHHFWHVARNAFVRRALLGLADPTDKVLDIGCGPGIFLSYMQGSGLDLTGVEKGEPPAPLVPATQLLAGTDVFSMDGAYRESAAVLLLLDVLEHLEDRLDFLARLRESFPNVHHLLLTVPARPELWSTYDEYWGHRLRYDRRTLEDELGKAGFAVERSRYFFQSLYLASWLAGKVGQGRDNRFAAPRRTALTSAVHSLAGAVLRMENRLMPGWIPGSSLLCVARPVR